MRTTSGGEHTHGDHKIRMLDTSLTGLLRQLHDWPSESPRNSNIKRAQSSTMPPNQGPQRYFSHDEYLSSRPPRSRSIAIKHSPPASVETDTSHDQHYDWATWRLYHRIVDHRQKHPLTPTYFDLGAQGSPSSAHQNQIDLSTALESKETEVDDGLLEGEVFELEL